VLIEETGGTDFEGLMRPTLISEMAFPDISIEGAVLAVLWLFERPVAATAAVWNSWSRPVAVVCS
jgi:hypothetical protein